MNDIGQELAGRSTCHRCSSSTSPVASVRAAALFFGRRRRAGPIDLSAERPRSSSGTPTYSALPLGRWPRAGPPAFSAVPGLIWPPFLPPAPGMPDIGGIYGIPPRAPAWLAASSAAACPASCGAAPDPPDPPAFAPEIGSDGPGRFDCVRTDPGGGVVFGPLIPLPNPASLGCGRLTFGSLNVGSVSFG